jgi:hypothetical protein
MNRQMLTAEGQIAGVTGPNDCSGGDRENQTRGQVFNRWALTLNRFDWRARRFALEKVLLDTSIDPTTKQSRAILTAGPMRGAVIRSAYDPDVVRFRGEYLVSFECTLENGEHFGVSGTSSCIGVYDPARQTLDLGRTRVIVSGSHITDTESTAAAVPQLLVYQGKLYLYWSALSVNKEQVEQINIRGAQLLVRAGSVSVKGDSGALVHSSDRGLTTRVWAIDATDPTSNTSADLRAVWVTSEAIVAAASLGGEQCTSPSGTERGCFRLALVRSQVPLRGDAFNRGQAVDGGGLPSNPQEYTRPIRDPQGAFWLIGHFIRPTANGLSDARPMPNSAFWQQHNTESALIMFPLADKSLWPKD